MMQTCRRGRKGFEEENPFETLKKPGVMDKDFVAKLYT
jgi:hypothetical protein